MKLPYFELGPCCICSSLVYSDYPWLSLQAEFQAENGLSRPTLKTKQTLYTRLYPFLNAIGKSGAQD